MFKGMIQLAFDSSLCLQKLQYKVYQKIIILIFEKKSIELPNDY